jgi:membrane fusion protein (multidrug efflux system)
VEILDGLATGEKVITHGGDRVRPGQSVAIRAVEDGSTDLQELLETAP